MKIPVLLVAVTLSACATQTPRIATRAAAAKRLAKPTSPRLRLGWVSWNEPREIVACTRRVDDNGNTVGVMGPCYRIGDDSTAHRLVSWLNGDDPDRNPANVILADWENRCSLIIEDYQAVPSPRPARLIMITPSGKKVLDEWTPSPKDEGDAFQVEATFSTDGTVMASVHLSIGLGEGERIIGIAGAKVFSTPACE